MDSFPKKLNILIVDDDKLVLTALSETLRREGYEIYEAASGNEALKLLEKHLISLIICDQRMPGIQGIDLLKLVKEKYPDTLRMLLTGNGDQETAIQAINVGEVSHYLEKPWDDTILRQTVKSLAEKYLLKKENDALQQTILKQHKELERAHESLKSDLQLGSLIHEQMLVGEIPRDMEGFDIAGISLSSKEIDGDFFEFYRPIDNIIDVVMGDVMGKGIPAALVGSALKKEFMSFAAPNFIGKTFDKDRMWSDDLLSPEEILLRVHDKMVKKLINIEYFCSIFYGRFDLCKQTFTYLDCGSPEPIYFNSALKRFEKLKGEDFPLGVIEEGSYHSYTIDLKKGDFFVLFSDGVTETKSLNGEQFGQKRLEKIIEQEQACDALTLLNKIKDGVSQFSKKEGFDDDFTLIIIKINAFNPKIKQPPMTCKFLTSLSQLQVVRDFIADSLNKCPGAAARISAELQLAINEIFCNIVKHGNNEESRGPITISIVPGDESVTVEIADKGDPFDPSTIENPSFSGDRDDGFGWYMIKKIVSRVNYMPKESNSGWNHLTVVKDYQKGEDAMNISEKHFHDVVVITLEGKSLDAKEAPQFKKVVHELISKGKSKKVIFDLQHLEFIDSSGLGSLLSVLRNLHSQGGDLKLANMNSSVRAVFELVSMHKIFEIFNNSDDAVRSFK